ncbi:unnamed protein product [Rhizophagus irregularis]|nr:unnamed protein product [Rhizophagus irregularis]
MKKLMRGSAKLTPNLIVNLPRKLKNKARDDDFTREAQKIFSMVNNITTKVNNIEEACHNEFSRINVIIENLQNETNQHYAVVQRSDFDQQNVSNESEANSTNKSETNS